MATIEGLRVDEKGNLLDIAKVTTSEGLAIYALPLETFPNHQNNVYFIDHPEWPTLIDVGTRGSHQQLLGSFEALENDWGVEAGIDDVRMAFITHGHGDHFGNAHAIRELGIPLVMHQQAAYTLRSLPHRLPLYRRHLGLSGRRAGYSADLVRTMVEAPFFDFDSLEADQLVDDGDTIGDGWELTFVPGHAPGQLVLAVDDVLFTADHLLSRITPAQGPASRQPGMGLDNYLRSLRKIRPTSGGMLGLGGHEEPIHDIPARIDETITHHEERLRIIHELCLTEERTGADICRHLFGEFEAQGLILALSETLAHIEYLYLIGVLDITNSEAPGDVFDDVLYYVAREGTEPDDIDLFAKQG